MFRRSRLSSSIPDDVRAAVDEDSLEGLMRRADRGGSGSIPRAEERERSGRLTSWQGCGSARGVLTGGDRGDETGPRRLVSETKPAKRLSGTGGSIWDHSEGTKTLRAPRGRDCRYLADVTELGNKGSD